MQGDKKKNPKIEVFCCEKIDSLNVEYSVNYKFNKKIELYLNISSGNMAGTVVNDFEERKYIENRIEILDI